MKRVLSALVLTVMVAVMLMGCSLTVPRPEIKEGEFDFSVTYEFHGQVKTVSGVYVCKYNGTEWALDGGSYRDWKGCIKGGEMEEVIELGTSSADGKVELNFDFDPGYFMGESIADLSEIPQPYISVTLFDEGMYILHDPDEVEEHCGARIVSFAYEEPIENAFGLFK